MNLQLIWIMLFKELNVFQIYLNVLQRVNVWNGLNPAYPAPIWYKYFPKILEH